MPISPAYFSRRQMALLALAGVLIVIIGLLDYLTGPEIAFSLFYLAPISLSAWYGHKKTAILVVLGSALAWFISDVLTITHSHPAIVYWNALTRFGIFIAIALLLSRLHAMKLGLEETIRMKTAALVEENEERQRLEQELLEIEERERQRVGRDLHDTLGQELTGIAFLSKELQENLAGRRLPEAADAARIVKHVNESIDQTRLLAKGLCPVELGANGLMIALEELAHNVQKLFSLNCRFECDAGILIENDSYTMSLYRIAQEAVHNAVKHSGAKNIVIQLSDVRNRYRLQIADDGIGMPNPLTKSKGMGLAIMKYRAKSIHATLNWEKASERGTVVVCSAPKRTQTPTEGNSP
jgi:signal transduction histidine kinase